MLNAINYFNLIAIVGPTAVGKSKIALAVAQKLGKAEIISADSCQVYKYLDIPTAKLPPEEQQGIPHHLIDVVLPGEEFTLAQYQELAYKAIQEIWSRGNLPILAGGTGLYFKAVTGGMQIPATPPDWAWRGEMQQRHKEGVKLWEELKEVDPETAKRLHPSNVRRIIRALEVHRYTGKPLSFFYHLPEAHPLGIKTLKIGLNMERQQLYETINKRVDKMVQAGLVQEVKSLMKMGYRDVLLRMKVLGYPEIIAALEGEYSLEEGIELFKRHTRQYAKRQLTWFNKDKEIIWLNLSQFQGKAEIVEKIYQIINNI
jgi:tRNA dimethylallyltransferase